MMTFLIALWLKHKKPVTLYMFISKKEKKEKKKHQALYRL